MHFMFLDHDSGVPIPGMFHSVYLGGPFCTCVACEAPLLDNDGPPYMIHKVFVGPEAVFEMAMCADCMVGMRAQYSQESLANLTRFMDEQLARQASTPLEKVDSPDLAPPYTWEDAIRACHLCGKLREACRRYEISGLLLEDRLFVQPPTQGQFATPMMICNDCTQQLSKLISKKTRELWDRFMDDHFPSPPGLEVDEPDFKPVLF